MVALLGFIVVVTLVMRLVPESPAGRLFAERLVDAPLKALRNFERHHVIFGLLMAGFALSLLGGGEALALMGPELLAAYAMDVAIYLDVVLISYAASTMKGVRSTFVYLRWRLGKPLRRMRGRRKRWAHHGGRQRKPANDDEPEPAELAA